VAAELKSKTVDLQPKESWLPTGGPDGEVKLQADSQEYTLDEEQFVAQGNVRMDFKGSYLYADELRVDLRSRIAVATGHIRLVRGPQEVLGDRIEYNFAKEEGALYGARGIVNTKAFAALTTPPTLGNTPEFTPGRVVPTRTQKGRVVRFQAERIRFSPKGWQGEGVRATNDPFDPPELELRSQTAVVSRNADGIEQLDTGSASLVFDQGLSLPLPALATKLGGEEDTVPLQVGYDAQDRGGFFYQQNIALTQGDGSTIKIEPRFFLQQAIGLQDRGNNEGFSFGSRANLAQTPPATNLGDNFGLGLRYRSAPDPKQQTNFFVDFNGLNFENLGRRVRLRAEQRYILENGTGLTFTYAFRERTFNGIFGNQPVSQRSEVALDSAVLRLNRQTDLTYTTGLALIQAPSDRSDLALAEGPSGTPEITLGRLQTAVSLTHRIPLFEAEPTPSTREFLAYTSSPVTPGLALIFGATGVGSYYTANVLQGTLTGTVRLAGTFGRFAREGLDFTQFGVSYSQALIGGQSPFIYDRAVTTQRINFDILQQLYGPIRIGIQSSWDAGNGREIDRWYVFRYDRRTYGLSISYSSVQRAGVFEFRIDDFNWGVDDEGRPSVPTPVNDGLVRRPGN